MNSKAPGHPVGGEVPQEAVYQLVPHPHHELLEQNIPRSRVIHSQHHLPVPEKRQTMEYILRLLKGRQRNFKMKFPCSGQRLRELGHSYFFFQRAKLLREEKITA